MVEVFQKPALTLLSSIAHAVGKTSFESLTTEQRLSAMTIALLCEQKDMLADLVTICDAMEKR